MGPDPRGRAGEGADGTGRRLRGSIIQRGHSHAPPPGPARDPNGVMSMNKLMILPLAAATALAAGCASTGGYGGGYDDGGYGYYDRGRSAEHTSELQSLMRNPYAVLG